MTGLIDLIRNSVVGKRETVVFWHTAGILYAYADQLPG